MEITNLLFFIARANIPIITMLRKGSYGFIDCGGKTNIRQVYQRRSHRLRGSGFVLYRAVIFSIYHAAFDLDSVYSQHQQIGFDDHHGGYHAGYAGFLCGGDYR